MYNKEEYIEKTLRSVLSQTMETFEVIIVNDGSTDDSIKKVEQFQDSRIQLIHIVKSGVSKARNTAIKNAKYSWIAFLDADDWWAPTFLEEILTTIKQFPNYKVFATGRSLVYKNRKQRYKHSYLPVDGTLGTVNYYEIIGHYLLPPINSSCAVIDKKLLEESGMFNENQKFHEDHDLWMRICNKELIAYNNKNLTFYRKEQKKARLYPFEDFMLYLQTLVDLKKESSYQNKKWLLQYTNKFIPLTFFKFYSDYSGEDKSSILNTSRSLLNPINLLLLKMLSLLPFNLYHTFKALKINGS